MKLSKRLQMIADMVGDVDKIYDVGCDHGYLDIYMAQLGYECIAIDVRKSVIEVTQKNVLESGFEDKITVLLNDGLNNLTVNDNDLVVLSGLGARTILKITEDRIINTIIIQSNDNLYLLRKTLIDRNYHITDEQIVFEDNKYYVAVRFELGAAQYTDQELLLGPILLKEKPAEFLNYLKNMHIHFENVLLEMPKNHVVRKNDIELILEHIKTALE